MMPMILTLMTLIIVGSWDLSIMALPLLMLYSATKLQSIHSFSSFSVMFFSDNMSTLMIMLTLWISTLMLISSAKIKSNMMSHEKFLSITLILCLILIMAFSATNMLTFYIFFEASLIPTLLLILTWGYQPERLQAGMYMMLYTITASIPLLMGIIILSYSANSSSFITTPIPIKSNIILTLSLSLAFLVKMPIYTLHLWLPKAHVEAPVAGSMILAGVLLKLGGYGLMRMSFLYPQILSPSSLVISVSLWGAMLTTIMCIRQLDMKSMIAYSSVSHMALVITGIYSNSLWGWNGAMMMMMAHGLSSSGLFALSNMYYENTHTRSLFITKGLLFTTPSMAMWWMLMIAANMASPPTINLLAEILLISSAMSYSHLTLFLILPMSFFTMCYSLILYTSLHHGPPSEHLNYVNTLQIYFTINLSHTLPLFFLILSPDFLACWS